MRKLIVLGICSALLAAGASVYDVTLDTTPLVGSASGPFSLDLQLIDGSFLGDGNNTVTISNFAGGTPQGSPTLAGGASGSLGSSVTLTDTAFLNLFTQQFLAGAMLSFRLAYTTNVDAGPTPDQFSISILNSGGTPLPMTSLGSFGIDAFLTVDLDGPDAAPMTFAGDAFRAPFIGLDAADAATAVPEPGSAALVVGMVMLIAGIRRRNLS